jgi:CBS domain-containing protein
MKIKEMMRVPVDAIDPLTTVAAAAQEMRNEDVGCLLVGRRDRLVGIVTDRDIVVRALANGKNAYRESVWNVMSSEVLSCFDDQPVDEAVSMMGHSIAARQASSRALPAPCSTPLQPISRWRRTRKR